MLAFAGGGCESMSKLHVYIDGTWLFKVVEGNVFRIIYSDNLPQTGENIYITYILAFTGLIFIMLGVTLKKNEKNR